MISILCLLACPRLADAQQIHLLYRGVLNAPPAAADQHGHTFQLKGLSGITWAGGGEFWAAMDNSDKLVRFEAVLREDGSIRKMTVAGALTLSERHDNEGVAFAGGNSAFIGEEDTPGIHAFDLDTGKKLADLLIPDVYRHGHTVKNQGFESLCRSPDGRTLWAASERALVIDGNLKNIAEPFGSRTRVRLLRFDLGGERPKPSGQFVYQTSGVHELVGQIGLCDLAALPDGRLLALERSAAQDLAGRKSIRTRIFLVDVARATDVSGPRYADGLKDKAFVPAAKRPLYDGFVFDDDGENVEGLCLGPLSPGRFSVIGVADDSDGIGASRSRLVAFELLLPRGK